VVGEGGSVGRRWDSYVFDDHLLFHGFFVHHGSVAAVHAGQGGHAAREACHFEDMCGVVGCLAKVAGGCFVAGRDAAVACPSLLEGNFWGRATEGSR
jgi:hypothetical protein